MRLGGQPPPPQERLVWMEREREATRERLHAAEQQHVETAVRHVAENTRRIKAETERIERALRNPERLVGSKEPVRDGRVGFRFNGTRFAEGAYFGGLPPASRRVGKIGAQHSPPRRLQPMGRTASTSALFRTPAASAPLRASVSTRAASGHASNEFDAGGGGDLDLGGGGGGGHGDDDYGFVY